MTTRAPASTSALAIASPSPLVAPVTSARVPPSSVMRSAPYRQEPRRLLLGECTSGELGAGRQVGAAGCTRKQRRDGLPRGPLVLGGSRRLEVPRNRPAGRFLGRSCHSLCPSRCMGTTGAP